LVALAAGALGGGRVRVAAAAAVGVLVAVAIAAAWWRDQARRWQRAVNGVPSRYPSKPGFGMES
jgi:hypothetical protein